MHGQFYCSNFFGNKRGVAISKTFFARKKNTYYILANRFVAAFCWVSAPGNISPFFLRFFKGNYSDWQLGKKGGEKINPQPLLFSHRARTAVVAVIHFFPRVLAAPLCMERKLRSHQAFPKHCFKKGLFFRKGTKNYF